MHPASHAIAPRTIASHGSVASHGTASHRSVHAVRARPPFEFDRTLSFACGFTPMAGEQDADAGSFTKALIVDGVPVVVRAEAMGEDGLEITIASEQAIDASATARALDRARFVLGVDDDLATFLAKARSDAPFAPLARALHGFHHLRFPSAFEITCWAILAQRTPMGLARKQKRTLTERYGAALELDGRTYRAFPDAARLRDVPASELARIVPVARKVASLEAIADTFAPIDADAHLRALPFADAERWLGDLPGIGAWSTAFVLFRGLGRMERATLEGPLLDCARSVYGVGAPELTRIADSYGSDVGYWALYLRVGAGEGAHALARRRR